VIIDDLLSLKEVLQVPSFHTLEPERIYLIPPLLCYLVLSIQILVRERQLLELFFDLNQ